MTVREEIKEVILRAALMAIENEAGKLSTLQKQRLQNNLEGRIPLYTGSYPILELLDQLDAVADAGQAAAVATTAAIRKQRGQMNIGWDDNLSTFRTPITDQWSSVIKQSATEAAQKYFHEASTCFDDDDREQATEHLCSAIICSIAAVAALLGWPHRDSHDDLRIVVGLATGSLPTKDDSIYSLLQSASQQGQNLNSAFAAAMGQPEAVRSGAYDDAGRTPDEAMMFAQTVVTLANQLGQKLR